MYDGGPVHPCPPESRGLTLRDYFAAAALTGIVASPEYERMTYERAADAAYAQAERMLASRSRTGNKPQEDHAQRSDVEGSRNGSA
jgi:hypothetical protein